MAERKAVNKYYPPDWTPNKGSLNKYVGQHPLRERARKLKEGILVIRFELPYNIWCGGCGAHVGMGVRYNAEKKKVGNYYSTPIYRFRMKCHLCDNYFEIETDPKNCDYNVVSGARRKEERWEASATETIETTDKEDAKRMAVDAMFKLEHGVEDVQKSKKVAPVLHQLQEVQEVWKDDYSANKLLRKKFRDEKKATANIKAADDELRKRASLDIPLVPEKDEDVEKAKKIRFYTTGFDAHKNKTRKEISSRSWFSNKSITPSTTTLPGITLRKRKNTSTQEKEDWRVGVVTKTRKPQNDALDVESKTGESNKERAELQSEAQSSGEHSVLHCSREQESAIESPSTEGTSNLISQRDDRTANDPVQKHRSLRTTFATNQITPDMTPSCSVVSSVYSDSDEVSEDDET